MRKERIEVRFRLKMEEMDVMGMENMGKNAKQLTVDMFRRRCKSWRERTATVCREDGLVLE